MPYASRMLVSGLTVVCLFAGSTFAQPVISVDGDCPRSLTFRWEGATPDRRAGLVTSSRNQGTTLPPGVPCSGTILGVGPGDVQVAAIFRTGADGRGKTSGRVSQAFCGKYLQMVVEFGATCPTSNVVQIPE